GLGLCSVIFPLNALLFPGMPKDEKLGLLGMGSLFGAGAYAVAKNREHLEKKYESLLNLQKENSKHKIREQFGYSQMLATMKSQVQIAQIINKLPYASERAYFAQLFGFNELIQIEQAIDVPYESINNNPLEGTQFKSLPLPEIDKTPTDNWILEMVQQSLLPYSKRNNHHYIISAPTQSGKSHLVNYMIGIYGSLTDCSYCIIDPKCQSNWLVPASFKGYDQILKGLTYVCDELDKRKDEKLNNPDIDFSKLLVVLDEYTVAYNGSKGYPGLGSEGASEMLGMVQRILCEAAYVNISLILIGQSPLTASTGLQRPIMECATFICLNKTVKRWLNDKDFPLPESKTLFKKQYNELARDKKRIALVVPMVGDPVIHEIPNLDLSRFTEPQDKPTTERTTKDDSFQALIEFYLDYLEEYDCESVPDQLIADYWLELTGKLLTGDGLNYLIEMIKKEIE
ncbi:hypothetical protein, partial [Aetokthonos hydrillicola]